MSALPPKADILHCGRDWRYSITSSAPASRDCGTVSPRAFAVLRLITSSYLVGACTGMSAGFLALENAVDVAGGATELVNHIRAIGDQAAVDDEVAEVVNGGQFVAGRQRNDQITMKQRQWARRHDQAAIRGTREGRDGALDLVGVGAYVNRAHFHADRRRHVLDDGELADPGR